MATGASIAEVLLERHLERLGLACDLRAVVEFELLGGGSARRFQLELDPEGCVLRRRSCRRPAVTISLETADLVRLLEGEVTVGQLFLSQRLAISGDVLLASRLPQALGLPRARSRIAA